MAHCTLSLRIAEQSLSGLSIALRATGGGEVPAQLNARLGILLEGCPEGRAGDHRIVGVDHDLHDLAAGAQFLDAEGVTFQGPSGLGLCSAARLRARCPTGRRRAAAASLGQFDLFAGRRLSSPRSRRSRRVRTAGSWVKLPPYGLTLKSPSQSSSGAVAAAAVLISIW